MKIIKSRFLIGVFLLVLGLFYACTPKDSKTITLGYAEWAEDIAMTSVAKVILEEQGYEVDYKLADIGPVFQGLSSGRIDVFLDAWYPLTHREYLEKYGKNIEVLGTSYTQAQTGLAVPDYVPIRTIDELNDHQGKFSHQIVGIDLGAGIMRQTEHAISDYGLELELSSSSANAMMESLEKAIQNDQWIVLTAWTPHPMFSQYDLKFLEDPKNSFGKKEEIKIIARKGFSEAHPDAAQLFENMKFTDEEMNDLLQVMEENYLEFEAAEKWVEKNRDLINSWWPKP